MKKNPILFVLLLGLVALFEACDEETNTLSSWREDLADLYTLSDGRVDRLVLDDGTVFPLSNTVILSEADTVRRAFVAFLVADNGTAQLGGRQNVLTADPIVPHNVTLRQDPLSLVSAWRGGAYINLRLNLLTGPSEKNHYFGFFVEEVAENPNGGRLLKLNLYHDQNGDDAYYTRAMYLCCSLRKYEELLTSGDSIRLNIETYKGPVSYTFPF